MTLKHLIIFLFLICSTSILVQGFRGIPRQNAKWVYRWDHSVVGGGITYQDMVITGDTTIGAYNYSKIVSLMVSSL